MSEHKDQTAELTPVVVITPRQETVIREPFTFVRTGDRVEAFYRGKSCGIAIDGDTQSLAVMVDVLTDRLWDRAMEKVGTAALAGAVLGAVASEEHHRRKPLLKKLFG